MHMFKEEFIGAVTFVRFSKDGSILYVGAGATLYLYHAANGELLASHSIFSRGILHGADFATSSTGDWSLFYGQKKLTYISNLPSTVEEAVATQKLNRIGSTRVFDDWIVDARILTEEDENASVPPIAIGFAKNYIQVWDGGIQERLSTIQCSDRCVVYALSFHGRRTQDLIVASGTVFQQILLWHPFAPTASQECTPTQRLHSHDGVLFKLTWSQDASFLASVSDDRTVQLWSNATPEDESKLEAAFLHANEAHSSSKVSVKEQVARPFHSVFRAWGHAARLWDVQFCGKYIVTSSEDCLVKVWTLGGVCAATLHGHDGKHVWRVAVHPSNTLLASGGGDGAVKLWDMQQQIDSNKEAGECPSIHFTPSEAKDTSSNIRSVLLDPTSHHIGYAAMETGDLYKLDLSRKTSEKLTTSPSSHDASRSSVSCFAYDPESKCFLLGDATGHLQLIDSDSMQVVAMWKGHRTRVLNIWWSKGTSDSIFTASADGLLCEWTKPRSSVDKSLSLVCTYKITAKAGVSSLEVVETASRCYIVCGDGRGHLYVFNRFVETSEDQVDGVETQPASVLKSVHGRDLVSSLVMDTKRSILLSSGHDGYICKHRLDLADDHVSLECIGRYPVKGMTTIKRMWLDQSNDLLAFGFHSSRAILENTSAHYRLFSIDCGGWKRPHDISILPRTSLGSPAHTLLFSPTSSKDADVPVIQVHSTIPTPVDRREAPSAFKASIHDQFHSKIVYCLEYLEDGERVVTGSEDNSLRLHRRQQCRALASGWRWRCVDIGVAHTTAIRSMTSFQYLDGDVVITGGGKHRLNVWRVGTTDVLEHLCGYEKQGAEQDQRILGLTVLELGSDHTHQRLVVSCDSEGVVQLLLLDLSSSRLVALGHVSASSKPILSCGSVDGRKTRSSLPVVVTGATDGTIHVWNFAEVTATLETLLRQGQWEEAELLRQVETITSRMTVSAAWRAHDMGVNCLAVLPTEEAINTYAVVSGGDDQNLCLNEFDASTFHLLRSSRKVNASGSAIRAVCSDNRAVFSSGYDQRVSHWTIESDLSLSFKATVVSECADVANVAVCHHDEDYHEVIVVGQGLQVVRFEREK